jgi:hypothetical protein
MDSEKINRAAWRLQPKPIDSTGPKIQGHRFPATQIASELLEVPLVDFTTMDATRILGAAGIQVHSADEKTETAKIQSEERFREYLR